MSLSQGTKKFINPRVFKINVGFLLVESPGYSRDTRLDIPELVRIDDLEIETLRGDLRLTRTSQGILVAGQLDVTTVETCTRCLQEVLFTMPIRLEELFGLHPNGSSQFIVDEDNTLDLAPLVREETLTNKPTQILCHEDCKGLCVKCGHNLNEGPCDCETEDIDPRWNALQELQTKLSQEEQL